MTAEKRIRGFARVEVVVEIDLAQPWGPEASLADVHRLGAREAQEQVENMVKGRGRILSSRVKAIISEEA